MARQKNNIVMRTAQGMFGKQVVFKRSKGRSYVAAPPEVNENRKPTSAQSVIREEFKRCMNYAKKAFGNADRKQRYEAAVKPHQRPYNVAFLDAFYPPEVESINAQDYQGQTGNSLSVLAKDDFSVERVEISIHNAANELIEAGAAVLSEGEFEVGDLKWVYTVTRDNPAVPGSKITAKAYDLAGNEGVLEVTV